MEEFKIHDKNDVFDNSMQIFNKNNNLNKK